MGMRPMLVIGVIVAACVLGILNSGGYRYGVSDQAFYLPAVIQHLDRSLFPRDRALFHAQDRFMLFDDLTAAVVKTTGIPVPTLFFVLFVLGLVGYFGACVELGRHWYRSSWSVAALIFILTLRHRITLTGVNTLEGYLHPRMLAFSVAVWSLVAFLRGRSLIALVLVTAAAALHTTTALWFALWLGAAMFAAEPRLRRPLAIVAAIAVAGSIWALWFGPMREGLQQMDARWVSVLDLKDYLFPTQWPLSAWLANLSYPAIVWAGYRMRVARSLATPREGPLVFGVLALAALFLLSLPFVMMRLALAVQLQVSRVFWMLELMAAIYLVWMALELARRRSTELPMRRWVAVALAGAAVARGTYIMRVEQPGRPLVQIAVPQDDWTDVMQWLRSTPLDTHVLADPNHAFRYGTSERILGERDVLLEGSKDTALAIYSRAIAYRVRERIEAIGDFDELQPDTIKALAAEYDLGYLVTERPMPFTRVYANRRFNVYSLKVR
jgi:hypothetical protein